MKRIYESLSEIIQQKKYGVEPTPGRIAMPDESQFLNSRPEPEPLIGIFPMTGEGIEANVDDLSFWEN